MILIGFPEAKLTLRRNASESNNFKKHMNNRRPYRPPNLLNSIKVIKNHMPKKSEEQTASKVRLGHQNGTQRLPKGAQRLRRGAQRTPNGDPVGVNKNLPGESLRPQGASDLSRTSLGTIFAYFSDDFWISC